MHAKPWLLASASPCFCPLFICCCDPVETKETLRFAEMARAITNSPVVNREPKDELIHRLQLQLAELQDQLKLARDEGGKAATEEVLQQLNVVEAAYADLQADMVGVGGAVARQCGHLSF